MVGRVNLFTDHRAIGFRDNSPNAFGLTRREGSGDLARAFQRHHEIADR